MEGEEGSRVLNRNKRADKYRPRGIYTLENDKEGGFPPSILVDPANRDSSHVPYIAVIIPEICSKCSQRHAVTTAGFTRDITSDPPLGPI